jgi:hypothetical protein
VFLPDTVIRIEPGAAGSRYFGLVVSPRAASLGTIRALRDEVEEFERGGIARLEAVRDDDDAYLENLREFEHLVESVERTLVDVARRETKLAVRLDGFEALARDVDWETVLRTGPLRFPTLEVESLFPEPSGSDPRAVRPGTFAAAEEELARREAERPIDLDRPLPSLELLVVDRRSDEEVDRYNRFVERYNRELLRRREFRTRRVRERLILIRLGLERISPEWTHTLLVRTERKVEFARRTWEKMLGSAPEAFVSEPADAGDGILDGHYGTLSLLVVSHPSGAELSVDGVVRGRTPAVLRRVPTGRPLELTLTHEGCRPKSLGHLPTPTPWPCRRLEVVLDLE